MLPVYVRSPEELHSLVTLGETVESLFLDFKEALEIRKPDWQMEIAQDVVQFANTEGGCLLIGVEETKNPQTGLKLAKSFKGVTEPDRVREWVETAVTSLVVPSTISHTVDMVTLPTATIVAVNVLPSRRLVYVWEKGNGTIRCVYRTNHGKARMNPDEMERQMMNGSRAARLAFLEARRAATEGDRIEVLSGVWRYQSSKLHYVSSNIEGTVTDDSQEGWFQIAGRTHMSGSEYLDWKINLPFDVLRSVWINSEGKLAIILSVRLLIEPKRMTLEPF